MHFITLCGSLRKDSINNKLLTAIEGLLPSGMTAARGDIGTLPLFNADDELKRYPAQELKEAIRAADGVIIVSPEYSRSIPGVLKNAIDWLSRPSGDGAWDGKPVMIAGASGGGIGTALAQYDLKKVLMHEGAVAFQREVFIGLFKERFDEEGTVTDTVTKQKISDALAAFAVFAQKNA